MIAARLAVVAVLAAAFSAAPSATCAASAAGTVGIVIEDEQVREFCVQVDGADMGALDAVRATGVDVVIEDYGAGAVTICRVDGVGCDHPDEPCFCSCLDANGPCTFWGIYTLDGSEWRFATTGIGQMRVRAGDVLGLRWAEQTEDGSAAPTGRDPDGVCTRTQPVAVTSPAPAAGRETPWGLVILASVATIVILSALRRARGGGAQ